MQQQGNGRRTDNGISRSRASGMRQLISRDRCGAAVVEMAAVLPVFVIVVMGIVEFGRGMMVSELLANAARMGARRGAVDSATNAEIEQLVRDFCQSVVNVDPSDIDVAISINGQSGSVATAQEGDLCSVTVSVPFNEVSLIPIPQWLAGRQLRGTCTMEHEE